MSEPSPSGGGEGYGACPDEVDVGNNGKVSNLALICHNCLQQRNIGTPAGPISLAGERGSYFFPFFRRSRVSLTRSPVVWTICKRDW